MLIILLSTFHVWWWFYYVFCNSLHSSQYFQIRWFLKLWWIQAWSSDAIKNPIPHICYLDFSRIGIRNYPFLAWSLLHTKIPFWKLNEDFKNQNLNFYYPMLKLRRNCTNFLHLLKIYDQSINVCLFRNVIISEKFWKLVRIWE